MINCYFYIDLYRLPFATSQSNAFMVTINFNTIINTNRLDFKLLNNLFSFIY